jgi:hypothetical protein
MTNARPSRPENSQAFHRSVLRQAVVHLAMRDGFSFRSHCLLIFRSRKTEATRYGNV